MPRALVARPAVTGSLLATEPSGVTLICSAPGFGATTAVQQALAGSADEVRWVGLDETVPDEVALGLLSLAVGSTTANPRDVRSALSGSGSTWLVVDRVQPDRHPGLTELLEEVAGDLPGSTRLIVTSHRDLDIPAARRLDEATLTFGSDEAFELIANVADDPDVDEVAEIIARTQGWAVALVAAAQRLATHRAARDWLRDQAPVELLSDWFARLPDRHRDVLQQTCVLEVLGEGAVGRILGGDPHQILSDLQHQHAYVWECDAPPGHEGRWWRRHPMLTAFLRQRAGTDIRVRHSAAADWFIQTGDVQAAITHLIASGRLGDAATVLTDHESALLSTGQAPQVLQWYGQIASAQADRVEASLRTAWGYAMARDIAGADAAAARLRAEILAFQHAQPEDVADPRWEWWESEEALLSGYLAGFHGDPATVVSRTRRAMDFPSPDRNRDAAQLAPLQLARGLLWSAQDEAALELLDRLDDQPFPNDVLRNVQLPGIRALALCASGDIVAATQTVQAIDRWVAEGGVEPSSIELFAPALAKAWIALEQADIASAQAVADDVLERAQRCGHLSDATWACLLSAQAEIARGDYGAAMRALSGGWSLALSRVPESSLAVPLNQTQALVHIASGDTVRAERLIRRLPPGGARAILSARAGLSRQPVLSRRTLEAVVPRTPRLAAQRHMLLAAVQAKTSARMAQGHLREAAAIAARHGLRQLLVPAAGSVVDLANETVLESDDANLRWLLQSDPGSAAPPAAKAPGVSNLSRGELQLLTILPSRAKNVEIAERLGVSVNTVKTRLRRLYTKLGAANRDEAIDRARERGLLESG